MLFAIQWCICRWGHEKHDRRYFENQNQRCNYWWWVSEFTFKENSRLWAIFSISQNHASHFFYVVNSHLHPIHRISAISCEITMKLKCCSLPIMKTGASCHSQISRFTQMVKSEITFMLDSQKFCLWPIANCESKNFLRWNLINYFCLWANFWG